MIENKPETITNDNASVENIDVEIVNNENSTLTDIEHIESEENAEKIVESVQLSNINKSIQVSQPVAYDLNVHSFEELTLGAQLAMFKEMSTDPQTGISNPAMGLLKFQRAKELNIPWANAVSHMHIIKNKVGIDINICQAIMSRPGNGIRIETIEDYKPLYNYLDAKGTTYREDILPPNVTKVAKFSDAVPSGQIPVILFPQPIDYRTILKFTRKKKDIDGSWFEVEELGIFSWNDAITAKLPFTSGTNNIDPNSNWMKRPKFMIYKSAYWDGAKKIANDLLLGAYDIDDLQSI